MSLFIITKTIHGRFTYYLQDISLEKGKYVYVWNGLKDNAMKVKKDRVDDILPQAQKDLPFDEVIFINA